MGTESSCESISERKLEHSKASEFPVTEEKRQQMSGKCLQGPNADPLSTMHIPKTQM